MERIICLVIGYVCGLFQTGYIIGKVHKTDIREHGSGNAGTTNTLRTLGFKAGAITFAGDCGKAILAIFISWLIFHEQYPEGIKLLGMYAGLGAVLGHNYPFYMKFKGGKGIAVMAALTVSNCFWHLPYSVLMFFITLAFFAVPVAVTRYISLGSLLAYAAFFIEMVVFGQLGWFGMEQAYLYELYILVFLLTALAWWRHRANIRRLLNGTENKFGSGKSKSKEG